MKTVNGRIVEDALYWVVEVPDFGGSLTEGFTRNDAITMLRSWIQDYFDDLSLSVDIELNEDNTFQLSLDDELMNQLIKKQ